ncbi:hypothetical protein FSP39_006351 [Pinctada imbricata]|uniref:Reverse transcriptase domain-containing protein n=1 Tax=Pinctada imbricata TaxID=66713 RepID=A0AA88XKI6_PINIB|nr:hypothetical protein FSP39_006351 [Pinctada imbricata]
MLRKLYFVGLTGKDWKLMQNWYTNLTSQVKWEGQLSSTFTEGQGVRQGGIWSPTAYKMYINPVLDLFEEKHLGLSIGATHLASPTCADDELLMSKCKFELHSMNKIQEKYANLENYTLSEQKSKIMIFNNKEPTPTDLFTLNGKPIEIVNCYKHLGITRRDNRGKTLTETVEDAIKTARRTIYSLMGAGLHGYNGVNPKVERTADAAVYILSGEIPIEADVDKKILSQLMNIFRGGGIEKEIALR